MVAVKEIELEGHIIDSLILPKAFDAIMDAGGDFDVLEFQIGKHKSDTSYARILIKADSREQLDYILSELLKIGAKIPEVEEVRLKLAPKDRTLPEGFYSTTNHPTYVLISGEWVGVENIEMDVAIVVDTENKSARGKPISDIKKGDLVVVGNRGIRVEPPERPRSY
ncbi:MAG TPA: TIGR00300 family protein, partial [Euryarchaeota archaeon]|nr:TIGR00300 family protein [Euryarchaeota archaeon]